MPRLRLQPFNRGLYIDLSTLPDKNRDIARLLAKEQAKYISHRFLYSSTSLNMWRMFACQSSPILTWSDSNRLRLSYYRLISRYLTPAMKEEKAELEIKHVLVFGECYPASIEAMIRAHGAEDIYSIYQKEEESKDKSLIQSAKEIRDAAQALGKLGGMAKSPSKAKASQENGRLGGRPKGSKNRPKEEEIGSSPLSPNLDLYEE